MKSKIQSKRQEKTRLAFMNALLTLLPQKGLDQISVSEIAELADYGRWVFYQYFTGKEELAWETFIYWMTILDAHILDSVKHLPSPQREYQSWKIIFEAFHDQRNFIMRLDSLIQSEWRNKAKEFLIQQFLGHLTAGNFAIAENIRPEIAARLYIAAIMELLEHWGQNPEIGTSQQLVDEFYHFIFKDAPPHN